MRSTFFLSLLGVFFFSLVRADGLDIISDGTLILYKNTASRVYCQTNAECMKRGLPLHVPRRSRTLSARQATTSSTAGTSYIQAIGANGVLGYLGTTKSFFGLTTDMAQAIIVNTPVIRGVTNLVINSETTPRTQGFRYLAGSQDYAISTDLGTYGYGVLAIAAESPVPRGPSSATVATTIGTGTNTETEVWYVDTDNTLTLGWVNSDGRVVNAVSVYQTTSQSEFVAFADSLDNFNFGYNQGQPKAVVVTLKLVSR